MYVNFRRLNVRLCGCELTCLCFSRSQPLLWYSEQWWCPWAAIVIYLVVVKVLLSLTRGTTRKYTALTVLHNASVALESLYIFVMLMRQIMRFVATNGLGYWGQSTTACILSCFGC